MGAIDKNNPVDRAEFVNMQAAVGASGAGAATATTFGTVKKAATVANCTVAADGTSAGTQLNLLLTSLRNAGVIV